MTPNLDLKQTFQKFDGLRVLIVGDLMVDNYILGKVERVSPEAPVPVVDVTHLDSRLGGAGNVALNIKAMGGIPIICSVIGKDKEGEELKTILENEGIYSKALLESDKRKTTTKTRIIGNNHQLLRFDYEEKSDIDTVDSFLLEEHFFRELEHCNVVIFEDYNKGVLHKGNIQKFISKANALGIPTVVDPKKANFKEYKNTRLFKPNLKEMREGLNLEYANIDSLDDIEKAIDTLELEMQNQHTLVTLSERGVIISDNGNYYRKPAHLRNIADVSGAGDTVIAVASLCVALDLHPSDIAELSNLAGGLVCEKRGVVPIDKEVLFMEAAKIHNI
jgi:rfaE bifunctional protein kinase chain/domain